MTDIEKAKELLTDDKTIVIVKGDDIIDSTHNGIKPLIGLLNESKDVSGYSLADKIVGKAQAMLCVKANIKEVYARVMSYDGMRILEQYHIPYSYGELVEMIINRTGDDICPMEKTVLNIEDIEEAYKALNETVKRLSQKKN